MEAGTSARPVAGRYRVERLLGQGGMAHVHAALDQATGRRVALKRLLPDRARRRDDTLRFQREFHTLARLRHPRVVDVFDYGVDDEGPFYTMELLDGEDLRDLGEVGPTRACALLRDVASALAFLHTRRLIHRDLAPRNVRCTRDGRAKLIDFGVLATVGVSRDTAGTPPFLAPENVRGLPLDHRVDLYGLGALAYRLLTGRNAYPAKSIEDLEAIWRRRPPAPADLEGEVPRALSDLVMSMLSLDPLARPGSAVEVIDRLTAIGALPPEEVDERAQGYLVTTELVGRQAEIEDVRRMLEGVPAGRGRTVFVQAPSGNGKSRMLREIGLRAQLGGLAVIEAHASASDRGPLGLLRALASSMLRVVPTVAVEAAGPYAPVIARVLPQLRSRLRGLNDAPAFSDPAEERMRLQSALAAWFVAVAERRPLCILVDDLQRADEASAATLAALALASPEHALFVAVAVRTDEDVRAPHPIRVLAGADTRMTLHGLDRGGVEQLVRGLFGDVPNLPRLADVLHRVGRGNPMHTMELVHVLVRDEHIRFVDGLWLIRDLEGARLAEALAPALDRRIDALGSAAKRLAEVLAVHGDDADLGTLIRLAEPGQTAEQTFAALDELMEVEVLSVGSDRHRFRHDGIREAILRTIDDNRMRELHARVGRALDRADLEEADELRIGWHLFRGGDFVRGGELLEIAGTKLYLAQSFTEAIAPLQAALSVREQRPGAVRACLTIRRMLLLAGCMSDRRVAIQYIDSVIEGYRIHAGIRVAERLGPWVGRPVGLAVGLIWRMLLWLLALPSRRGPFPFEALANFFMAVGFSATVYSLSYDIENLRRLLALARPLAIFRRGINYGIFLLTESLLAFPLGRFGRVRECATEMITLIGRARDSRYSPISSLDLRTGEGGCRLMLALIDVAEQDPAYVEELDRLRELDLRYLELGIHQARLAFHRSRGEEAEALRVLADVEVLLVQLGSAWQMETWLAAASALAYGMNRDVVGLKRAIEDLREMIAQGLAFEGALELTRGEYHRERGELDASFECLERALQRIDEEIQIFWQPALAAMADTLVAMGDFDRAMEFARRGYALGLDPDVGQFANRVRSARAWALAEAGLGDFQAAAARLDVELQAAAPRNSPCLSGSLHEARAIVARQMGERAAYDRHRASAERLFSASKNPALMARAERLLDFRAERVQAPTFADDRSTAVLEEMETVVPGTSQAESRSGQDAEDPGMTRTPHDPDSSDSDSIEVSR